MEKKETPQKIIQSLPDKDLFHLKPDKVNEVVIVDKTHDYEKFNTLIKDGSYIKLRKKQLMKIISEVRPNKLLY